MPIPCGSDRENEGAAGGGKEIIGPGTAIPADDEDEDEEEEDDNISFKNSLTLSPRASLD